MAAGQRDALIGRLTGGEHNNPDHRCDLFFLYWKFYLPVIFLGEFYTHTHTRKSRLQTPDAAVFAAS